ncbi:Jerky -like [Araneus ventricosus]|uniref:Jerky-like n=1 Tax=Araneus ventricosus TaxID=182803 RepID=A0A4Y2D0T3_ARAVE|nr:Jerky -like [Araneus ventricosus]
MYQGVIESMKRRYRKQFLSKLLFEGNDNEEETACSIVQFWKALTLKDCVCMITEAWESVPDHTLKRSWRKLVPYLENVDQSNDSVSVTVTELNGLLKQIPGSRNCEKDVSSWLDCDNDDAGFQLISDDEIIAQVRKLNRDDDNYESDEDEVIETSKISNSDAFECFAKGLMWLEQQTDSDSTELMLLKQLRDRAAKRQHSYGKPNFRLSQCKVVSFKIGAIFVSPAFTNPTLNPVFFKGFSTDEAVNLFVSFLLFFSRF